MINNKSRTANKVHIAGRGSVVRQLRILVSQFRVLRTGTLSEIRPDNMYQPLATINDKHMRHIFILILLIGIISLNAQEKTFKFNYFGQEPPDTIATEFLIPLSIKQSYDFIGSINFSPTGNMIVFGVTDSVWSTSNIVYTKNENGSWTDMDTLNSCQTGINANPTFITDKLIYFTSLRKGQKDLDILQTSFTSNIWSDPMVVRELSVDTCREFMGSRSQNGDIFFVRLEKLKRPDENAIMNNEIYCANFVNGQVTAVKNIGSPINSDFSEVSPFIESNGRYLLFGSRRLGGLGLVDIYVSFRDSNGDWKEPKNVKELNSKEFDGDPIVTPDGKYIFFIRRQDFTCTIPNRIYWISSKILEKYYD